MLYFFFGKNYAGVRAETQVFYAARAAQKNRVCARIDRVFLSMPLFFQKLHSFFHKCGTSGSKQSARIKAFTLHFIEGKSIFNLLNSSFFLLFNQKT
jgi:hypothetical protein